MATGLELATTREHLDEIRRLWVSGQFVDPPSYFLSWAWIECWLKSLPEAAQPRLAIWGDPASPSTLFFLGQNRITRKKIIPSRCLFLNASGHPEYDQALWIEYNCMLLTSRPAPDLTQVLDSLPGDWDEIALPGMKSDDFPACKLSELPSDRYRLLIEQELPAYYVDLDRVVKDGYLELLSSNTRQQIRRSYRAYERAGKIECECAGTLNRALEIFEELLRLHQLSFRSRNRKSSFITPYSKKFHKSLIESRFDSGEIQLLRITSRDRVIGCLYNFIHHKRVYFFQSGLELPGDKRLKPGNICHCEAIQYNAARGLAYYDFLAGRERYKSSMSTDSTSLVWARIQKNRLRFRVESLLGDLVEKWRRRR